MKYNSKSKKSYDRSTDRYDYKKDKIIKLSILNFIKKKKIDEISLIHDYSRFTRIVWLSRIIEHYELFKKSINVPGNIIELGVYKGNSLLTFAKFLEIFCPNNAKKKVYGFDTFEGFEIKNKNNKHKFFNEKNLYSDLKSLIEIFDNDRFINWKPRIEIYKGDVSKTLLPFLKKNQGIMFSLIHFDLDLYKPTKYSLNLLWPKLSRGGVMIFDNYNNPNFPGETKAVNEFIEEKKIKYLQASNLNQSGAFLIK